MLTNAGLIIANMDDQRPWGGFYVIEETNASDFIKIFFQEIDENDLNSSDKLSPKILIVAPNARLSWQYHHRRAEIWKCLEGPVSVIVSEDDVEREVSTLVVNTMIRLKRGERHRLIGLDGWGVVAEVWKHTDKNSPSDEEDIVRLQDDYGR